MRRFTFFAGFTILWTSLIMLLSSQPYQEQNIQPFLAKHVSKNELSRALPHWDIQYHDKKYSAERDPYQWVEFVFRKGAHLTFYALLAVLWRQALRYTKYARYGFILSLIAVGLTAILDEWNQSRIPGRTSLSTDVVIDLSGGLIGLLVVVMLSHSRFGVRDHAK